MSNVKTQLFDDGSWRCEVPATNYRFADNGSFLLTGTVGDKSGHITISVDARSVCGSVLCKDWDDLLRRVQQLREGS